MAVASKSPIVAIVGRANVGKSTLFNRLIGARSAITDGAAGTTRDANYGNASWNGYHFTLIDTAGLQGADQQLEEQIHEQIASIASLADVIVVAIDATSIPVDEDRRAAKLALRTGKPVILAMNKMDARAASAEGWERLGISQRIPVSAIQGTGTGDLLDTIVPHLEKVTEPVSDDIVRIALIGRPNVGKSSLLNTLVGKQSAIVGSLAGTTRDTNSTRIKYKGRTLELIDTAGVRRRGKIERGVEKFSVLRTMSAIRQADICLVLMDSGEPSVAGDQHIAGMVVEAGRGLILVANKWDTVEDKEDKTQARYTSRIQRDFQFVWWAPLIFTSATTGHNTTKLFELALDIYARRQTKIATGPLNRLLEDLVSKQAPAGLKGKRPKINYATQTGTNPPHFTFFASNPELIHFSYRRYLENGIRAAYDFTGTSMWLSFRSKRKGEE